LLQHTAARLERIFEHRNARVFRLGGDDFAVVLFDLRDPDEASLFAYDILAELQQPAEIGGMSLSCDAAIGIALAPQHGSEGRDLLRCAEVAMYHAKHSESTVALYRSELDSNSRERLQLMTDLRQALGSQQLELHYQPKIDLGSGRTTGVEALIRWRHPTDGFVSPALFIPMAEVSPIINQITDWVLDSAIAQIANWTAQGIELDIAVNISARNLGHSPWCDALIARLGKARIDPRRLELEITETALMHDAEAAQRVLQKLAETGMRIAIDDFGTGYSSLAYLQKLPIHTLKIDRSFVARLADDPQSRRIIETVINLAHGLQLHTVAEGIEDQHTASLLTDLGCEAGQGRWIAEPQPLDTLSGWLRAQDR